MAKYEDHWLTKARTYTADVEWVNKSRMKFGETKTPGIYRLSLLGVINGFPILSKFIRLACEEVKGEIVGWKVVRWQ